jgi:hypothetical protein
MGLGTITLLSMLVTPAQAPSDITPWKSPQISIPIDYNPAKRNELRELLLYTSNDQGSTWQQQAVANAEKENFSFTAPADGVYWFKMVTVDKSGRRDPADLYKDPRVLKVLFDTKKPIINITDIQRSDSDLTLSWKTVERNPDWSKFKVEYSTPGKGWTVVPTRPEAEGSTQFKVSSSAPLSLRISMVDQVGNVGEAIKEVAPSAVAAKPQNDPIVPVSGTELPHPSTLLAGAGAGAPPAGGGNLTLPPPPVPSTTPPPSALAPAPTDRARDTRTPGENLTRGNDTLPAPVKTTSNAGLPAPPLTDKDPLGISPSASPSLPAPQVINVTSFKLGFEVEDKGASGLSKADVYITRDEGKTWKQWSHHEKPDGNVLVDLTRNNNPNVEGIYGMKMVLYSGAGLSREIPKPGETPDLRFDVDVTPPIVKIYEPVPDSTQKDTMILRWQAVDRNLSADPITLEWADGPRGPWIPIVASDTLGVSAGVAKRLANTGSYAWKLPSNFPTHKVYLKIAARDVAGNLSEATTAQPVLVDLNKPAAVKLNILGGGN